MHFEYFWEFFRRFEQEALSEHSCDWDKGLNLSSDLYACKVGPRMQKVVIHRFTPQLLENHLPESNSLNSSDKE